MRFLTYLFLLFICFDVDATDIVCSEDVSKIKISERVEIRHEEGANRYHVFVDVPLKAKTYNLSTIYMDVDQFNSNNNLYVPVVGAPLRWVEYEGLASTKIIVSNLAYSISFHLEYGLCGPTHNFDIDLNQGKSGA